MWCECQGAMARCTGCRPGVSYSDRNTPSLTPGLDSLLDAIRGVSQPKRTRSSHTRWGGGAQLTSLRRLGTVPRLEFLLGRSPELQGLEGFVRRGLSTAQLV